MSKNVISVNSIGCRKEAGHRIVNFHFEENELYFKFPLDFEYRLVAESFVCALLLVAMQRNVPIEISAQYPVSLEFLDNISQLQDIYVTWYPWLQKIEIHAAQDNGKRVYAVGGARSQSVAAFFSGGIDSSYTLLKHKAEITDLVYVRGIDMQLGDEALWQICLSRNRQIAEKYNKRLVVVETNIRMFIRSITDPEIGWYTSQGCGLAAIAHLTGFSRHLIPSSNTYLHLHPFGSHPLTDRYFSSDVMQIEHDGCEASRSRKLQQVAMDPQLLDSIRVCWQDMGFNCGKCDKCLHFRMALTLLNLQSGDMAHISDLRELRRAHVTTVGDFVEWQDNLELAECIGDKSAARAIKKLSRPYHLKQIAKQADQVFFGGALRRAMRKRGG